MRKKITSILLSLSIIASLLPTTIITAQAKTGGNIEIGDYVQMGTYYGEPIVWRCVNIDENGPLMLADKIICFKPFDSIPGENPDYLTYESNYWNDSSIRSWLNSEAAAGEVEWLDGFPPDEEHVWKGYNEYDMEAGFLTNFSQTELDAIKSVEQKSIIANYQHDKGLDTEGSALHTSKFNIDEVVSNYDSAYANRVTDKMFLLDVKQLYAVYQNSTALGSDYYIGEPTEKALEYTEYIDELWSQYKPKCEYWLRTPETEHYLYTRYVACYGSVGERGASNGGTGIRPAFYLDEAVEFTDGSGSENEPYTLTIIGTKITYNTEDSKLIITSDQTYEDAKLLIAEYSSDGVLVGVTPNTVSIGANSPYEMEYTPNASYTTKVMLWNSLGEMIPLTEAREYKDSQVTSLGGNSTGAVVLNIQGTGGDAEPQIEYTAVEDTDEMKSVAAVDASLTDGEPLDGTAEIRIKYDADKGLDATNLLPGYFNEETQEWETVPYMLDEENHEAIIITDHFSKYGLFEVQSSGMPKAFAKPLEAARLAQLKPETAERILKKFDVENPKLDEDTIGGVLESLDGAFNGKLMGTGSNINSIVSGGGSISEGVIGGIGKQFTILAVVGAAISAVNNTYKRGLTDTETLKAITKAGIGAGVAFASAPIQLAYVGISMAQMTYDHEQEKALTAKHNELKLIFDLYKKQQGKRSLSDWKKIIDPFYEKYYVNELNSTTDNAEERYNKFYNSVHNVVSGYAYSFMDAYQSGELYDMYLNVPLYTNDTATIAQDLCYNYEIQIYEDLSALFLQYSRRAYSDAVKKLEAECEKERQELNKKITINFYEYGTTGLAKNYYVRFFDKKSEQWRADFDSSGNAKLEFTLLSYLQLGSPDSITVFNKETDRAVGTIDFPEGSLEPDKTTNIPFNAENVSITVNIREIKQNSSDDYMFAGRYGRFAPISSDANVADYAFDLDSNGSASMTFNIEKYYNDGAPDRLEIFDENDKVIYQIPFDIAMTEIAIDGEMYSVNITCADGASLEHYGGRRAEIVYFKSFDTKPTVAASDVIGSGECVLMFPKSEYEFRNKDYTLYIYDENGEKPEEIYDLSKSFDNGTFITYVNLTYEEEPHDILTLGKRYFEMKKGDSVTVNVKSGLIDSAVSADENVATASRSGAIHAKGVGDTTITFMDEWGNYQEVYVVVTESGYAPGSVNFKVYTVYECSDVIDLVEKNYAIGEKPNGEVKADFYTGDYGIWRIDIRSVNSISGGTTYQRMNEYDPKLYRYYFGDGGMNKGGFDTSVWLENVSHSGFTWVFHNVVSEENGWYTEVHDVYVP